MSRGYWPGTGVDCYAHPMDMRPILLAVGVLAAAAAMAEAYRWVDEDGVVHYSDRPDPRAEKIELPEPNTTAVRPYVRPRSREETDPAPAPPFRYESLVVTAPGSEEHLWNIEGVLNVSLALSPALQPGHQLRVYYDGQAQTVATLSFRLEDVYRGEHNLQAEILDQSGRLMIRSEPSRFYVHQSKVQLGGS